MKNKKGFTLIEILTVIGLIGIILIIAIPAISNIRKSIMIRELESKKETIVSAAEVYAQNNQSLFPKEGGIIQIPVRTLVYYGYINEDSTDCDDAIGCVMNPVNNTSMNNEIITIKKIKSVTQATFGEVNEHVITFHANGATSVGGSSNFISIGCDTFTNSTCTIRVPSIERDGFTKVGFGESANSTTADYLVGQDILFNDNISNNDVKSDYYAITKKDIEVTFDANGGSFVSGSSSKSNCTIRNTSNTCAITTVPSVEREGYTKKTGWYNASSNGSIVSLNSVSSTQTVYAQWVANTFTVTWKNWNETVLETDTGVAVGTTPTYNGSTPTKATTSNQRFTFTGWTPTVTSVTGDATYTATFSTTTYTCSTGVSPSISGTTCTCSDTHEVEKTEYYAATPGLYSGHCYCSATSTGIGDNWSGGCGHDTCSQECASIGLPYVMSGSNTTCPRSYSCSKPDSWGPDSSHYCGRHYYVNEPYTYNCTATTN